VNRGSDPVSGVLGSVLPLVLVCVLAASMGCASRKLSLEELPEQPIAILYWEPEDARRRAEILEKAESNESRSRNAREGVARLEDLGTLVGMEDRSMQKDLSRYPGYLALVDPRTGNLERVAAARPGARPLAWSSDGKRLMFVSGGRPRVRQLYEYDRTTSEVRRLTSGKRMHPTGTYGPEGRLAYVSVNAKKRRAGISIQVTAPHGARPEVISNGVGTDRIAWAREEGPLVYVKYMKQTGKRKPVPYLVARDPAPGGEERVLGPGKDPVMTADGSWVVYSAEEGEQGVLRRVRPSGQGRSRLGKAERDSWAPAVSPDGAYVAYVGREPGLLDRLFVRRFDGAGDRVLIADGAVANPTW